MRKMAGIGNPNKPNSRKLENDINEIRSQQDYLDRDYDRTPEDYVREDDGSQGIGGMSTKSSRNSGSSGTSSNQ